MCHAVRNTSGTLAAWLKSKLSGIGITFTAGTAISSQLPPSTRIAQHRELRALVLQSRDALCAVIAEVHGREQHALAGLEAGDVLADLDDLAGNVAAQDVRQLHPGQPLAHPQIQVVQGAGFHPDQHLVFAQLRVGNVFVAQNFRTAEFVNADGFHDELSRSEVCKRNHQTPSTIGVPRFALCIEAASRRV